jgi:hypothetical protein
MTIRQCADLEVRLGPQRLVVDLIGPPAHGCESGQVSVTGVIIARSRAEVRRDRPCIERRREAGSRKRLPLARVRKPAAGEVGLGLLDPGRRPGGRRARELTGQQSGRGLTAPCRNPPIGAGLTM